MPLAETHEQATSRSRMGSLVGYQGCTATRGSHGKSSRLSACFCMPTSSVEHSSTALLQRVDRPDSAAMAGSSDHIMSVQLRQMVCLHSLGRTQQALPKLERRIYRRGERAPIFASSGFSSCAASWATPVGPWLLCSEPTRVDFRCSLRSTTERAPFSPKFRI